MKLQCVAEKEVELSNECPDISECNVILSYVYVINGLYFEQLWYVDHHSVLYNICVNQTKKSQVPNTYWNNDEWEDITLTLYKLLADYMMG